MFPIPAHTDTIITKWWWTKDQEDGYYPKDLLVTGTAFKKIPRWENTSNATSSGRNREPAAAIIAVVVVVVCDPACNKALNLYIDMVDFSGGLWCWRGTINHINFPIVKKVTTTHNIHHINLCGGFTRFLNLIFAMWTINWVGDYLILWKLYLFIYLFKQNMAREKDGTHYASGMWHKDDGVATFDVHDHAHALIEVKDSSGFYH